jgi:hypothetical protein
LRPRFQIAPSERTAKQENRSLREIAFDFPQNAGIDPPRLPPAHSDQPSSGEQKLSLRAGGNSEPSWEVSMPSIPAVFSGFDVAAEAAELAAVFPVHVMNRTDERAAQIICDKGWERISIADVVGILGAHGISAGEVDAYAVLERAHELWRQGW